MGVFVDVVSDRTGSAVGKLQLSGDRTGNATLYTLPATSKGIIAFTPYIYAAGPVADDLGIVTLRVTSTDFKNFNPDYEVFLPPMFTGSAVAPQPDTYRATYPAMWPTGGGETIEFDAIFQSAPSGSFAVGCEVMWTDDPSQIRDGPFGARTGGTPGANGSLTSTGTSATSVTGTSISMTGNPKRIRSIQAILAPQGVTSTAIAGWGSLAASEITTQRFPFEPVNAVVAQAQGAQLARLTRRDFLDIPVNPTPSTIVGTIQVTKAPSAAGVFAIGVIYS